MIDNAHLDPHTMAASKIRHLLSLTALVTAFVTVFVTSPVRGSAVCQLHNQRDNGNLGFEESDLKQLGYRHKYTELLCGARNFCNIQWTKGGQSLNLSKNVELRDRNQTLVFKSLDEADRGVYTCMASDGKTTITRRVTLIVIESSTSQKPVDLQHQSCSNATANIGGSVTFYCEFLVPKQDCGNSHGSWTMVNKSAPIDDLRYGYVDLYKMTGGTTFNETEYPLEKMAENGAKCQYTDCDSLFGFMLETNNISQDAFGTYRLTVYSSCTDKTEKFLELSYEPPTLLPRVQPKDWHEHLTIPLACVVGVAIIVLVTSYRFRTDFKLRWKDFAGKRDESKDYDVYLSYDWNSETDRSFAISLVKRLEERGYKVSWEMDCLPGGDTDEDILEILKTSSRCVIIFSPDYLASHRNLDVVYTMDNVRNYKREIIPIIYRDISSAMAGEDQGALVKQILSMPCLHYDRLQQSQPLSKAQKIIKSVIGSPYSEKSLNKEMLLRLPPPARTPPPSSAASDLNLVSSEVPQHISSRESVSQYQPSSELPASNGLTTGLLSFPESPRNADLPTILASSNIYPDISRLSSVELSVF
ncbi:interleukin-1 receptor accessory protein-like 1-B [Patiria miniata]|uniref:Soluble interferon alpha/beta receptor OPG204 n=1 Tax=Patiria miniata TaxID=46514 RepID=A0A913ZDW0_PATMI|nr:interleukin-1 receptor accessory protein-like 1-B [Patiria miniata]